MMIENSKIESQWKGKLLVRAENKKTEFPKNRSIEIQEENPIQFTGKFKRQNSFKIRLKN